MTSFSAQWHTAVFSQAQETEVYSPDTGHTYRIQIAKIGDAPLNGYPVMYILDGDT